jgi:hypothetical protein
MDAKQFEMTTEERREAELSAQAAAPPPPSGLDIINSEIQKNGHFKKVKIEKDDSGFYITYNPTSWRSPHSPKDDEWFVDTLHNILYSTRDDLREAKNFMMLPENFNWFSHFSIRPSFRKTTKRRNGGKKSKKYRKKSRKHKKRKSKKSRKHKKIKSKKSRKHRKKTKSHYRR